MELTPIEKAIVDLIRRTPYGSITIHIQNNKIIWVDDNKRHSPEAVLTQNTESDNMTLPI